MRSRLLWLSMLVWAFVATLGVPLALLIYAASADADVITRAIHLSPGGLARVRVECGIGDCPEPAVLGPYGKPHGPGHVHGQDYGSCAQCHDASLSNSQGALAEKWVYGSLCPTQGPFFAPTGLMAKLSLAVPAAYGQTIMTSTGPLRDPYTGVLFPLVGEKMALYLPGESARCIDCHNHHDPDGQMIKPESLGWNTRMISHGCLYCHTAVGQASIRTEIKRLLGD